MVNTSESLPQLRFDHRGSKNSPHQSCNIVRAHPHRLDRDPERRSPYLHHGSRASPVCRPVSVDAFSENDDRNGKPRISNGNMFGAAIDPRA